MLLFAGIFYVFTVSQAQITCVQNTLASNKEALYAPYKNLDYSSYSFCVRLYIHVIRKSDGTGDNLFQMSIRHLVIWMPAIIPITYILSGTIKLIILMIHLNMKIHPEGCST